MPRLPPKLVVATGNRGKLAEIRDLLGGPGIEVVAQADFGVEPAEETGETFAENALLKARHALEATGHAALADDSGLAVDALDGRPGVYSARYAGPDASDDDNIDRLLRQLEGVEDRRAAFVSVICLLLPGEEEPLFARGEWRGEILAARRGAGGFGYDPVFFDPEAGMSAAELAPAVKNARSHRAKALRGLVGLLEKR